MLTAWRPNSWLSTSFTQGARTGLGGRRVFPKKNEDEFLRRLIHPDHAPGVVIEIFLNEPLVEVAKRVAGILQGLNGGIYDKSAAAGLLESHRCGQSEDVCVLPDPSHVVPALLARPVWYVVVLWCHRWGS